MLRSESRGEQRRQRVGGRPGEQGSQEPREEGRGRGPAGEAPMPQEGEESEEQAQQLSDVDQGRRFAFGLKRSGIKYRSFLTQ